MSPLPDKHSASCNDLLTTFTEQRNALIASASRILGCRRYAEDVVHDVFLKLYLNMPEAAVREPAHYLFRMVRNQAIDHIRHRSVEQRHTACSADAEALYAGCASCPEAQAIKQETMSCLRIAMSALPQRTRQVFQMHRLQGYTQKELATRLGVSPTLVNFMIRDAHNTCRAAMQNSVA